jgi:hypothetical protein
METKPKTITAETYILVAAELFKIIPKEITPYTKMHKDYFDKCLEEAVNTFKESLNILYAEAEKVKYTFLK